MSRFTPSTKLYMASWLGSTISYNPSNTELGIGFIYVRNINLPRGVAGPYSEVRAMDWRIHV